MKGLNLNKLKKDDIVFARTIFEKRFAYLAEIERGTDNNSLRRLLEYIDVVVEYSQYHEEYEAEKEILEQVCLIVEPFQINFIIRNKENLI